MQDLYRYPKTYHPILSALKNNQGGVNLPSINYVEWARDAEWANNHAVIYDIMDATYKLQKTLYKTAMQQLEEVPGSAISLR